MRPQKRAVLGLLTALALMPPTALSAHAAEPRLLYHAHVDAAHIAWENGRLAVKVVDKQTPVPTDTVIVRLGPDADPQGQEVSRIQLDPAQDPTLSFLGEPGEILWRAPQTNDVNFAPVWPGFGAGNWPAEAIDQLLPHHSKLRLLRTEGPGRVEVYRHSGLGRVQRYFSSTDARYQQQSISPGFHGHFNWTFSKPGDYTFWWQGETMTADGQLVTSEPTPVRWKVGTDSDVGLAPGTTGRIPIKKFTANQVPAGIVLREGEVEPTGAPTQVTAAWPAPQAPADPLAFDPTGDTACVHKGLGTLTASAGWDGKFDSDGYPTEPTVQLSQAGQPVDPNTVFELGDGARTTVGHDLLLNRTFAEGSTAHRAGVDRLLRFDSSQLDADTLRTARWSFSRVKAPEGADVALVQTLDGKPQARALGSEKDNDQFTTLPLGTSTSGELWFSQPGFYQLTMQLYIEPKARNAAGQVTRNYRLFNLTVAVGQKAIDHACERDGGTTVPPAEPPAEPPVEPEPTPTAAPSTATTSPTSAPSADPTSGSSTAPRPGHRVVLEKGHADVFHVSPAGDQLHLGIVEDETGYRVAHRPEDVTLKVRDAALTTIPEGWPGAGKHYLLPIGQDSNLLWPGWDTQSLASLGVTRTDIEVTKVDGPGFVKVFSQDAFGTRPEFFNSKQSADLPGTIESPSPSHTHAYWAFEKPGVYTMTVRASAVVNGVRKTSNEATYTWVVGDKTEIPPAVSPEPTPSQPTPSQPTPSQPTPSPSTPAPSDPPLPKPGTQKLVLDHGHVDIFNLTASGSTPVLNVSEDVTGSHVQRKPSEVTFVVKKQALMTVPRIGLPIDGSKAYVLPESQDKDLLWAGWNTLAAQNHFGSTDFVVEKVTGPGAIHITRSKPGSMTGQQVGAMTGGRTQLPGTIRVGENAHVHANWFFTKPGTYQLTVRAKATPRPVKAASALSVPGLVGARAVTGKAVQISAPQVYTIVVGAADNPGADKPADQQTGTHSPKPGTTTDQPADTTPQLPAETDQGGSPTGSDTTAGLDGTSGSSAAGSTSGGTSGGSTSTGVTDTQCRPVVLTSKSPATGTTTAARTAPRPGKADIGTDGHFDLGTQVVGKTLVPSMKDDRTQPAVWKDPSSVVLALGPQAEKKAPAMMNFLAPEGSSIWVIGSTQESGVPWLGQNTMHPSVVEKTTGEVSWTLDKVEGPGKLAVFTSGALGGGIGQRLFDNAGGPKSTTVPANTHAHPNWVFTAAGAYTVSLTQSAKLKSGEIIKGSTTLRFTVGDDAAKLASAAGTPAASTTTKAPTDTVTTTVVGRTPDGRPCVLTEGQKKQALAQAAQTAAKANLARTGAPDLALPVGAAALCLLAGGTLVVRGRREQRRP